MSKVLGIGGVFVKSKDPDALRAWYREMLGIELERWGGAKFVGEPKTYTVWNAFKADTAYFEPSKRDVMINLRVDDADGLAAALRAKGVEVLDRREAGEFGVFCYVVDPDGTLLELFQPV